MATPIHDSTMGSPKYSLHSRGPIPSIKFSDPAKTYQRVRRRKLKFSIDQNLEILHDVKCLFPKSSSPIAQNQNEPQRPRAFVCDPYGPLNFSGCMDYPHDMATKILKWLPRFNGDHVITINDHVKPLRKY